MFGNIFEDIITLRIEDINTNLNTIANIKPFDKLYFDQKYIFIDNSYVPSIQRWFRGSNRINTIKFIKYILVQSYFQLEYLKKCNNYESTFLHNTLLNGLKNAKNGLANLKITYSADSNTTDEIQNNINYINGLLST
jgi:hypothetical protein